MGAIFYFILFAYFSGVKSDENKSITIYNRKNDGNARSCLIHAAQAVLACCDLPMLINLRELETFSHEYDKILANLDKPKTASKNISSTGSRKKGKGTSATTAKIKQSPRQQNKSSKSGSKKRRARSDGAPSTPAGFRPANQDGEVVVEKLLKDTVVTEVWVNLVNTSVMQCSEEVKGLNKTYIPKPPNGIPFTSIEPKLFSTCLFQKLISNCPVSARLNSFDEGECKETVDSIRACDPYLVPEDCYGKLYW